MNLPSQSSNRPRPNRRIDDAPISVNLFTEAVRSECLLPPIPMDYADRGTTNLGVHLERFDCSGPIDRSIAQPRSGQWIGSRIGGDTLARFLWKVGVLRVAGRHAIYKLSVFDSAAALAPEEMIPRNGNETRLARFRASHFPARMHAHAPKGRRTRVTDDHRGAHDLISRVYTGGMTSSRVAAGC